MIKKIILCVLLSLGSYLLQSTVLQRIAFFGAVPDLALGILVYFACVNGTMTGQLSGFLSGLVLDLLSAAPLGFHTFIRTLIGAVTGLLKGIFFLDIVFVPMLLCFGATLFKGIVALLLNFVFSGAVPRYDFFYPTFWVELGMNTVSAPFLFGLLRLFDLIFRKRRRKDVY